MYMYMLFCVCVCVCVCEHVYCVLCVRGGECIERRPNNQMCFSQRIPLAKGGQRKNYEVI